MQAVMRIFQVNKSFQYDELCATEPTKADSCLMGDAIAAQKGVNYDSSSHVYGDVLHFETLLIQHN